MRIKLPFPITAEVFAAALSLPMPTFSEPLRVICTDSRLVEQGDLFVALRGQKGDGHAYLDEVHKRRGRLLSECAFKDATVVPDTRAALSALAAASLAEHRVPVVAITGSVGKTGTKDAVAAALGVRFCVHKTPENLNNDLGVAFTVLSRPPQCEILVLELGSDHRGEIAAHSKHIRPDVAIITAIGSAHIGEFGSLEETLKEKSDIIAGMREGTLFLNRDDPRLRTLFTGLSQKSIGIHLPADYRAENPRLSLFETAYTLSTATASFPVRLCATGYPRIYASLFALAVADHFGIPPKEAAEALSRGEHAKGRQSVEMVGDLLLIDDSYNASPEAVKAGLHLLSTVTDRTRIAVLGDMLQLGVHSAALHRRVGYFAAGCCEELVPFGAFSDEILRGAIEGGLDAAHIHLCADADACTAYLLATLRGDSAILIKSSHALGGDRIAEAIRKSILKK